MKRKEDIDHLIKKCALTLPQLEVSYANALNEKRIPVELRSQVKAFLGDLRSVLDYLAHEIVESQGLKPSSRYYFPILPDSKTFAVRMKEWFPGLNSTNATLYDYLHSMQPFTRTENVWIEWFNKINNENKHERLTPQERREVNQTTTVTHRASGGSVTWNKGVKFGGNVRVMGVPIDVTTQMPVADPRIEVRKTTWVDFHFEGTTISVVGLLKNSLSGITEISKGIEGRL